MLKYSCDALLPTTLTVLQNLKTQIVGETTHSDKYAKAKTLFANKTSAAWLDVKSKLALSAPAGDACYYCERDRYRDIDHIRPKRHYPEQCFDWDNYVYACVICNQDMKKDKYGVIDAAGNLVRFDRTHDIAVPVPVGVDALIHIRSEDPLDFLMLDLSTGLFSIIVSGVDQVRAEFTRELFELNNGELPFIRKAAYCTFLSFLHSYRRALQESDTDLVERLDREIRMLPHPTVLVEMRRQVHLNQHLQALFVNVPESIGKRP